ncbi:hypothetical protein [Nocardiopsis synnemataformans]|uniref:hypothetical protein n=1 Tax=Nocardiopsis synnemataformans TaxID=61305 RepID=UPI003EBEC058
MSTQNTQTPDPLAVMRQLGRLSHELDLGNAKLAELDELRIEAEGDYRFAYSKAYEKATGNMESRKQQAVQECDGMWRTWQRAESAVKLQQRNLKALYARIDVGRSIFSVQKAELTLANSGMTT